MTPSGPWDDADGGTGAAGGRADGADEVRDVVADLVRTRPAVAEDSERLNGYLRDMCPHRPAEVAVIVAASRAGVPDELGRASQGHAVEALSARLASRLNAESGIDTELARWAVDTWAQALGVGDPSRGPAGIDASPPLPRPVPPPPLPAADDDLRAMAARVGPVPSAPGPRPAPVVDEPTKPPPAAMPDGRTVHRKAAPAAAAPKEAKPPRRRTGMLAGVAVLVVGLGVVAVLLATGGDPDPTPATTVPPGPATSPASTGPETTPAPTVTTMAPTRFPDGPTPLAAGFYEAAKFQPRLTATVPDGWVLRAQSTDYVQLDSATNPGQILSVVRPEGALLRGRDFPTVAEAAQPRSTEPKPSDFVAWLGTNSRLSVSPATPVTKAGFKGFQVDVTASSPYLSDYCQTTPCVALFQLEPGEFRVFTLTEGNLNRFYVLTVGDRQILVVIESPPDELEAFVERADRIVESIAFTG